MRSTIDYYINRHILKNTNFSYNFLNKLTKYKSKNGEVLEIRASPELAASSATFRITADPKKPI